MEGLRIIKEKSIPCAFCKLNDIDEVKYGSLYERSGFTAHYYCVLMSNELPQNGKDEEGIEGFLVRDLKRELKRTQAILCSFCRKPNASIACSHRKCRIRFHYPCGIANGTLSQFQGSYKSFCFDHRPKQVIPDAVLLEAEKENTICVICQDPLDFRSQTDVIWAKCCHRTWYHRECIQRYALKSGYDFKCAICNNKKMFKKWVEINGVFVPQQDLLYDIEVEFAEQSRPSYECMARDCSCPRGRSHNDDETGWEMVYCRTCGADAIHIVCMEYEFRMADSWECQSCKNIGKQIKRRNVRNTENTPTSSSVRSVSVTPLHRRTRKRKREDLVEFEKGSECSNEPSLKGSTSKWRTRRLKQRLNSVKKDVETSETSEKNGDLQRPKRRKRDNCTDKIEVPEAGGDRKEERVPRVENSDHSEPSEPSSSPERSDRPSGTVPYRECAKDEAESAAEACGDEAKTDPKTEVVVLSEDESEPEVISEKTTVRRMNVAGHPASAEKSALNLSVTVAVRIPENGRNLLPQRAESGVDRSRTDGDLSSTVQEHVRKMIVKTLDDVNSRIPAVEKRCDSSGKADGNSARKRLIFSSDASVATSVEGRVTAAAGEEGKNDRTKRKFSLRFSTLKELNDELSRFEVKLNQLINDCSSKLRRREPKRIGRQERTSSEVIASPVTADDEDVQVVDVVRVGQSCSRTLDYLAIEEDEIIDVE